MFKWYKLSLGLLAMGAILIFGGAKKASAAGFCYCYSNLGEKALTAQILDNAARQNKLFNDCVPSEVACEAKAKELKNQNSGMLYLVCDEDVYDQSTCAANKKAWENLKTKSLQSLDQYNEAHGFFGTVIPKCLLQDELTPACKNVTVFVELFINLAKYLFGIVGALALAYFIYGGFVLILSQGNSEKVKSGTDAMLAAAIGLVIVFGAYLLIQFLGTSIDLESDYNLL